MSQPVLLNRLNEEVGIELHLLKNHPEEIDLVDFDYEHYSLDVPNVKIRGHTALWIHNINCGNGGGSILKSI
jgi:hypothetical protein